MDPLTVGHSRRASDLSSEVGARLLNLHMKDHHEAERIAEELNKTFFAHGDAVSRTRAVELGLSVKDRDEELEALMWDCYLGLEECMELREPWDPAMAFLADPNARASVAPPGPVQIPGGLPPQVVQQMLNQVMQTVLQTAQGNAPEVPFSHVNALVESPRLASAFVSEGVITGQRQPDGQLRVILTPTAGSWRRVEDPEDPEGDAEDLSQGNEATTGGSNDED